VSGSLNLQNNFAGMGVRLAQERIEGEAYLMGTQTPSARLAESIFTKTSHIHGLTKTVKPLLNLASVLLEESLDNATAMTDAYSGATTTSKSIQSLPSWQRTILLECLFLLHRQEEGHISPTLPGTSPHAETARRLAAILRLTQWIVERNLLESEKVLIQENEREVWLFVREIPEEELRSPATERATSLWNRVVSTPVRILSASADADLPKTFLNPSHTLDEALHRIIHRQLRHFLSRIYGLSIGEDLEYVHEMRVATRRIRAAMKIFKKAMNSKLILLQKEIKDWASDLGRVRDLDVLQEFLSDYMAREGRMDPFILRLSDKLQKKRIQGIETLLKHFTGEKISSMEQKYAFYLESSGPALPATDPIVLGKVAPAYIGRRLQKTIQQTSNLNHLDSKKLHTLRIQCKGCRYAAEFLEELYSKGLKPLIRTMTLMQDHLGKVHDADVYREKLLMHMKKSSPKRRDPKAEKELLEYLSKWRKRSLKQARVTWQRFLEPANVKEIREILAHTMTTSHQNG